MGLPNASNIRLTLINEDNSSFLSDDYVNMVIGDARDNTGVSDEQALRHYTCYMIAKNWGNLQRVTAIEGTSYAEPNPQNYLDMYEERMRLVRNSSKVGFRKVSTSRDYAYDDTDKAVRPRREGDTPPLP